MECINKNKPFISDLTHGDGKEWRKQYNIEHTEEKKQYNKQYYLNKKAQQLSNCINNITN